MKPLTGHTRGTRVWFFVYLLPTNIRTLCGIGWNFSWCLKSDMAFKLFEFVGVIGVSGITEMAG